MDFDKEGPIYKIVYINGTPLHLTGPEPPGHWPTGREDWMIARYPGKKKILLHYIDMLEKTDRYEAVGLYAPDPARLWEDFCSQFVLLEAAGGLVRRSNGDALFIYRRGRWDLPKGKIDPGESAEEAALREVREETGLREVALLAPLPTTYHVYRLANGKRVLKPTYWYVMASEQDDLHPEAAEDIEQAVWMPPDRFLQERSTYGNISLLLRAYLDGLGGDETS